MQKNYKKILFDILPPIFFFILIFLLDLTFLNLPYFWDAMQFIPLTKSLVENHLNLISMYIQNIFYKISVSAIYEMEPLFLYLILAIFFIILGESIWIFHLIIIFFGFLTLYFTYLIGSYLYNKKIGFMASLLLSVFPLFFAQTNTYNWNVPFTAFMLMTLYFFIKKNKLAYILSSILMVLTVEISVIVIFIIICYILYKNFNRLSKFKIIKNILFFSVPLFIFIIWMLWNKLIFGYFLNPLNVSLFGEFSFNKFVSKFLAIFIYNNAWILISINFIFLITILIKRNKKIRIRDETILLLSIIFGYFLIFSTMPERMAFLIRYALHIYPLLFIFTANSLNNLLKRKTILILTVSLLLILFIIDWKGERPFVGGYSESNLRFVDIVKTDQKMTQYIETNFPNESILAPWPQCWELSEPSYGYVTKSIKSECVETFKNLSYFNLVLYSPYSSSQKEILEIIKTFNLTPIKEFEIYDNRVSLYKLKT